MSPSTGERPSLRGLQPAQEMLRGQLYSRRALGIDGVGSIRQRAESKGREEQGGGGWRLRGGLQGFRPGQF